MTYLLNILISKSKIQFSKARAQDFSIVKSKMKKICTQ